ncbi:hypothetical protein IID10_04860 [candidate division KSB1 bacterium]|nr:hypothetical protein [candidate division KSB1 bacterium]
MSQLAATREISHTIARIHATILALIFALVCGVGLFGMTIWLLIKGCENIGPHLELLGQYFIGYSVTWTGSVIGLFYGTVFGGICGWLIGMIYNRIVAVRNPL